MEQETIHGFKVHPAASMLPNLNKRDLNELAADIKANGIISPPIFTAKGDLLDGRNRVRAWVLAGNKLKDLPKETWEGDDSPAGLVKAVYGLNVDRRHLNATQRVALRRKLLSMAGAEESDEETATAADAKVPTVRKVKRLEKDPARLAKSAAGDTSGRGRPAGGGPPFRLVLDRREMTPRQAATYIIEKWNAVPRSYLENFIAQLEAQWEAFEPPTTGNGAHAEETEEAGAEA